MQDSTQKSLIELPLKNYSLKDSFMISKRNVLAVFSHHKKSEPSRLTEFTDVWHYEHHLSYRTNYALNVNDIYGKQRKHLRVFQPN